MSERGETVLLVDDEENILSSLQRLLRSDGYRILTAQSADKGLEIMQSNPVWLVISDNAMPGTTGLEFLKQVRDDFPDTIRVMLTGYANFDAAMEAINRGEVYRFVTKPWDPDGLRLLVRQGLNHYWLVEENKRMQALIEEQNAMLKGWNQSLQKTVEERTAEIRLQKTELEGLYDQVKGSFFNSIKIFIGLVEMRHQAVGGHARKVAALSKSIAQQMTLNEEDVKNTQVGALLHDIGMIGMPDKIIEKEIVLADERFLTPGERHLLKQHPVLGQAALETIESLEAVGRIVRHHHERWDGKGYPDGLKGEEIPLGARIVAVADSFHLLQTRKSGGVDELLTLQQWASHNGAFDPAVVRALRDVAVAAGAAAEACLDLTELREGMVLSRDLVSVTGLLIIPKGESLKHSNIEMLKAYERRKLIHSKVHVQK
ncbi:MAG: response regulator [Chloroflexi bacterium]|nr:response regulator [Chloroflexota bacterium]